MGRFGDPINNNPNGMLNKFFFNWISSFCFYLVLTIIEGCTFSTNKNPFLSPSDVILMPPLFRDPKLPKCIALCSWVVPRRLNELCSRYVSRFLDFVLHVHLRFAGV